MFNGHLDVTTPPPVVKDLRFGSTVQSTCKSCGHEAELKSTLLRSYPLVILKMPIDAFGDILRCARCDALGARLDAEGAVDVAPIVAGAKIIPFGGRARPPGFGLDHVGPVAAGGIAAAIAKVSAAVRELDRHLEQPIGRDDRIAEVTRALALLHDLFGTQDAPVDPIDGDDRAARAPVEMGAADDLAPPGVSHRREDGVVLHFPLQRRPSRTERHPSFAPVREVATDATVADFRRLGEHRLRRPGRAPHRRDGGHGGD